MTIKGTGRKKKPTAALKLTGTFQKCRRLDDEPTPDVCIPKMPTFLKGEAAKEWKRITVLLAERKCVTEWDVAALAMYCQEWGKYVMVNKTFNTDIGVINMLGESTKILKNVKTMLVEFGLTPSSRASLSMGKADTNNAFAKLMKQKA